MARLPSFTGLPPWLSDSDCTPASPGARRNHPRQPARPDRPRPRRPTRSRRTAVHSTWRRLAGRQLHRPGVLRLPRQGRDVEVASPASRRPRALRQLERRRPRVAGLPVPGASGDAGSLDRCRSWPPTTSWTDAHPPHCGHYADPGWASRYRRWIGEPRPWHRQLPDDRVPGDRLVDHGWLPEPPRARSSSESSTTRSTSSPCVPASWPSTSTPAPPTRSQPPDGTAPEPRRRREIQGFFLNATHFDWTSHEIAYGEQISRLTGGKHFVVNTARTAGVPLFPATGSSTATRFSAIRRGAGWVRCRRSTPAIRTWTRSRGSPGRHVGRRCVRAPP